MEILILLAVLVIAVLALPALAAAYQTSETVSYDQLYSLVGRERKSRIADNYGNSQPTLDILSAAGQVEIMDGGEMIEERVMYTYPAIEWMDGRQAVSTDDTETVTTAYFPVRFAVVPTNISKTDELKAQKTKMSQLNFAESKITAARRGIRQGINTALLGSATGKAMLGFQDVIKDLPTSGTLGGINQATATWWRNQYDATSVGFLTQTSSTIFDGWSYIGSNYESASDIGDEVTHIGTGATLYGKALSSLESHGYVQFHGRDKAMLDGGRQRVGSGPAFRNATVYKDRAFASAHIYGFNVRALKLKIMKGANFAKLPFVEGTAQGVLAKISFYIVGLQLVPNNLRRCFVMTTVS